MSRARLTLLSALLAAIAATLVALPAAATAADGDPLPLSQPAKTAHIVPLEQTTSDGYVWQEYRNLDYPCAISGYQTFALGTPVGSDPAAPMPLWVRMRGGGVGFFDSSGKPQPGAGNKTEDNLDRLIRFTEGNDLNQRINALPGGFRDISVSMCSHDIYSGGDQLDPNNPNLTPQGKPRHTNGLFATKAAIQFAQQKFPTTRTFLHGTSAGSAGTWNVAYSLIKQDRPVTGFVADSGVANLQSELDQNAAGGDCARGPEALAAIAARTHPGLQGDNEPRRLIERGDLFTPAFNVWNRNDKNACGSESIPCTQPDGTVEVIGGMRCRMGAIGDAIDALPPSRHSENMQVCVAAKDEPAGSCNRHVVTTVSPDEYPNTAAAYPADYNGVIVDWVSARFRDTPPTLETKLLRARKLDVKRKRLVKVDCKAGGYERRTCDVRLTTRRHGKTRTIGEGERAIRFGEATRKVEVKLNKRGRKLIRKAPRKRGLRAKARLKVNERYTDRAGTYKRATKIKR